MAVLLNRKTVNVSSNKNYSTGTILSTNESKEGTDIGGNKKQPKVIYFAFIGSRSNLILCIYAPRNEIRHMYAKCIELTQESKFSSLTRK